MTTMPLGMCVMRIADSVLLTCWPPAPPERMVSILRSSSLIAMSTSSTSGSTATVAAEVWMRPVRLGVGHALHAVHAGLELQLGEGAAAADFGDDFLVAAHGAFAGGDRPRPSSPAWRRSARTCGTGRRRTATPRRRRCRRGFRG